jgi:L-malate glycosyltransferase
MHITTFLQGGAGRVITDLAIAQKSSGKDVTILLDDSPIPGYESYPSYLEKLQEENISLIYLSAFFRRDLALNVAASIQVRDILDRSNVKLIHAHSAIPAMIGMLARSSPKHFVPVILTMHGFGTNKSTSQIRTDVTIMNMIDKVIPVSQASANKLSLLGVKNSQMKVIPNGISKIRSEDLPLTSTESDQIVRKIKTWNQQKKPIIGCIGSIGKRKNQACLIRALSKISNKDYICLLIGEEETPSELSQLIVRNNLEQKVMITGYRDDIQTILQSLSCLVLPSRSEGLPISILEALREGVPVIGSNIQSIKEVITHQKTGLLFIDDDENDLAQQLDAVLKYPQALKEMIKNGNRLFRKKYTLDVMLKNYHNLYHDLITNYSFARH